MLRGEDAGQRPHSGRADPPATPEGRIVRLVDRIAYINHDIDDALRAGIISGADLPAAEIELLGPTGSKRIDTLARTRLKLVQPGREDAIVIERVVPAEAPAKSVVAKR